MVGNMLAFVGLFLFGFTAAATLPPTECTEAEANECLTNYNEFQSKIDAITAELMNLRSELNSVNAVFADLKAQEETLEFQIANPGQTPPEPARLLYARGPAEPVVVPPLTSNGCVDMLEECQRKTPEAQKLLAEEKLKMTQAQEALEDLRTSNTALQKRVAELTAQVQAQ